MKKLMAIAFLGLAAQAHAAFQDGNEIYELLRSHDPMDHMYAMGYIGGAVDQTHGIEHCAPSNVRMQQLFDMLKDIYAKAPALRDMPAAPVIVVMMKRRWPCAGRSNS